MTEVLENTLGDSTFSLWTGTFICSLVGVIMYAMFCFLRYVLLGFFCFFVNRHVLLVYNSIFNWGVEHDMVKNHSIPVVETLQLILYHQSSCTSTRYPTKRHSVSWFKFLKLFLYLGCFSTWLLLRFVLQSNQVFSRLCRARLTSYMVLVGLAPARARHAPWALCEEGVRESRRLCFSMAVWHRSETIV